MKAPGHDDRGFCRWWISPFAYLIVTSNINGVEPVPVAPRAVGTHRHHRGPNCPRKIIARQAPAVKGVDPFSRHS